MPMDATHWDETRVRTFWSKVPFYGSRLEARLVEAWYIIVPAGLLTFFAWSFWVDRYNGSSYSPSVDPFVWTLCLALFLSMLAFKLWQSTVRRTFAGAVESGIVGDSCDAVERFGQASEEFAKRMQSQARLLVLGSIVLPTVIICLKFDGALLWSVKNHLITAAVIQVCTSTCLILFSYGVGATAWPLVVTARWIASLSSKNLIRLQPGHSDGCCGLEDIGNCCLQSSLPLLIGIALCSLWSYSRHIATFSAYWNHSGERFLMVIIPLSLILMICFLFTAAALVFLPLRRLHSQMVNYRKEQEVRFTRALELELPVIRNTLAAGDAGDLKVGADRIKLVQALDPQVLKLGTWPFDKSSLVKYGATPLLSFAVSFGKQAFDSYVKRAQ